MRYYISAPPMNPLMRVFSAVLGLLVLAGAFFFGLIVLGVLLVVGLVFGLAFWLRGWWLRRGAPVQSERPGKPDESRDILDAEYTVVSRRRE